MRHSTRAFLKQERGSAAAEYALVLAIVGVAIALAASSLGAAIASALSGAALFL